MLYDGIRRCDLCASEILGTGGMDICLICRIAMDDDADPGRAQSRAAESREDLEGFALTAVVGRACEAGQAIAANDDRESKRPVDALRRKPHASAPMSAQGVVHRLAAGLRSIVGGEERNKSRR